MAKTKSYDYVVRIGGLLLVILGSAWLAKKVREAFMPTDPIVHLAYVEPEVKRDEMLLSV